MSNYRRFGFRQSSPLDKLEKTTFCRFRSSLSRYVAQPLLAYILVTPRLSPYNVK